MEGNMKSSSTSKKRESYHMTFTVLVLLEAQPKTKLASFHLNLAIDAKFHMNKIFLACFQKVVGST
jgi:hypothetical protein